MTVHEKPVGESVEWYTPPELFEKLGLTFDLDPASPVGGLSWVPAEKFYTPEDDGLSKRWFGRVWLNPPYGAAKWIEAMILHGKGLMLLASRTETAAFQSALQTSDAVCFLRDRLHFIRPDGTSGRASFGSALFAYGRTESRALRRADLGWTV